MKPNANKSAVRNSRSALTDSDKDILTLLNAAGIQIARDTALAALRRFARRGLATMRGLPPRFYINGAGSALCDRGL